MLLKFTALVTVSVAAVTGVVGAVTGAWIPAAFGGATAYLGALAGLALLRWAAGTPDHTVNRALGAIVGGMLLRMVLLGAGLVGAVVVLGLSPTIFLIAFFLVYLVTQILEIAYFQRAGRARAMAT